jgi:GTP1/Obg family GTP-binding protein
MPTNRELDLLERIEKLMAQPVIAVLQKQDNHMQQLAIIAVERTPDGLVVIVK